ncbi:DUF3562 domain-containing protein [Cupriavidus lacunae]|uniref:DUF3562 domain-containing protein n=1 Tax=Cupriavidus lacunae TaxID=2666307 RepID=A0A370MVR8_9BURK|nr:DUF3562 domain-containing protein [Cupriavidus lacunae]RDJ97277.1 hypothetical protein DN412_42670 [Cupriavidus lacunae]
MWHQGHDERIARLAEELGLPVETVKDAYLDALRDLGAGARIQNYLHVFVVKRVIALLRDKNRPTG